MLCRRPKLPRGPEETETVASKTFTALLGLGLLVAMGFAAYAFTMPSATTVVTTLEAATDGSGNVANTSPVDADAKARAANAPVKLAERALETDATKPEKPAAVPRGEHPRARTVGKKIVDPRLIEARKSVRVTMYSAPWCFICDRARSFLDAREVDLADYDVDTDPEAEKRLQQLNPTGTIPTFVIDGETIVGFHPWGLEDAIDAAAQEHFCKKNTQGAVCERLASAR